MAAGDRKIKTSGIQLQPGNPITFDVDWQLFVEDKLGVDRAVNSGRTSGSLGNTATFNALTGLQIRTAIRNAIIADSNVPPNDSVT